MSYLLNGPFQVLMALADAKLPWKQDPKATEGASATFLQLPNDKSVRFVCGHLAGLQLFAHHTAEEIGSFTAVQIAQILDAFARMGFLHEDR